MEIKLHGRTITCTPEEYSDTSNIEHRYTRYMRSLGRGDIMKHKEPILILCECCGKYKHWSTIYRGLQSRGNLMAVCPACKEYLERKDKEAE